ncbi:MAG: outer membrane beta-barrel protein [Limnohabitans sp.]
MKKLAIAAAVLIATIGAQAQTYGEIGYTATTATTNINGNGIKASPSAIRGILGYELSPNFAVEGMVAFGMSDGTLKVNGQSVPGAKMEIDNAVGVYIKPKTKLNDHLAIFARAGFIRAKSTTTTATGGIGSVTGSENSFSYGAGMSYAISPKTALTVDYMQYLNKDGFKVNGFTLGVGFKF